MRAILKSRQKAIAGAVAQVVTTLALKVGLELDTEWAMTIGVLVTAAVIERVPNK